MILSDTAILAARERGDIVIEPFDREALGSNSYDVHLADTLLVYNEHTLDSRKPNTTRELFIPQAGLLLYPGKLYLGSTIEYTETRGHVPVLDGKSSIGRLGIAIHVTAGKGDVGFCNHWTMEIVVVQPVRVYPGMPIGQLTYFVVRGEVERPYYKKPGAKYGGRDAAPQASRMHRNFDETIAIPIGPPSLGPAVFIPVGSTSAAEILDPGDQFKGVPPRRRGA